MENGTEFIFEDGKWREVSESEAGSNSPNASDVVEQAIAQAEVITIQKNEEVQSELLHSAEEVARNKAIEATAESERKAKEALFKNNKSACECFGYSESSTEKWAVTAMSVWHNIITAIWIVLGMLTFAPITFIARKLSVIIKNTWVAVLVASLIYAIMATSPFWIKLLGLINGFLG